MPIGRLHQARRAHGAARAGAHDAVGFGEMLGGARRDLAAGGFEVRLGEDRGGRASVDLDAGGGKRLARQIEPADLGVLVEVAQDVGELQRAAEMMREPVAGVGLDAEDAHREAADGARHAIAIKIERRPVGRVEIGFEVHRHAVDDGLEILAPAARSGASAPRDRAVSAEASPSIERVDVGAPAVERGAARRARPAVVGDVVDGAAEGVDRVHRLALGARQDAHGEIERAAGGRQRRRCVLAGVRRRRVVRRDGHQRPRVPAASGSTRGLTNGRLTQRAAGRGERDQQEAGLAVMHLLRKRIAMREALRERHREPADGGDLKRKPRVGDEIGERRAVVQEGRASARQARRSSLFRPGLALAPRRGPRRARRGAPACRAEDRRGRDCGSRRRNPADG